LLEVRTDSKGPRAAARSHSAKPSVQLYFVAELLESERPALEHRLDRWRQRIECNEGRLGPRQTAIDVNRTPGALRNLECHFYERKLPRLGAR
jgi:hypothetical protein